MSIILLLPVTITALSQIFIAKKNLFSTLAIPVDFGKKIGSNYILGQTKTWRGIIFMAISTPIVSILLYPLFTPFNEISSNTQDNLIIGLICGLGYSLGELPNSFVKRRFSIPSGAVPDNKIGRITVVFMDNVDSTIGILILFLPTGLVSKYFEIAVLSAILGCLFHFVINFILWRLKIKKFWT